MRRGHHGLRGVGVLTPTTFVPTAVATVVSFLDILLVVLVLIL